MSLQIRTPLLAVIALGMILGCATPAFAAPAWYQETYWNETGQTAYDLEKVLWGEHEIGEEEGEDWYSDKFASFDSYTVAGFTVLRWYDGTVAPGESAMVCFKTDEDDPGNIVVEVLCAWWTDAGGGFIAYAGAGTTVTAQSGPGRVTVTVRHSGKEFEAGVVGTVMGQITVSNVHYTVADTQRPLDELTEVLWTCHYDGTISPGESCETDAGCTSSSGGNCGPPDITWLPLDGTTLDYDQDKTYYLDEQAHETTVLFRFDAGGNTPAAGRGTWSSRELLQFGVCAIPTVSAWGMVVIAVLVLSAGTILIRRRRALAA